MNVMTKLGTYALGLVAVFAVAFGAGSLAGPVLPPQAEGASPSGGRESEMVQEHP